MPDSHNHSHTHAIAAPAFTAETLINVESAVLSKGGRRILENVSITVGRGEIVTLIGPNGAGKSMLIRVALGLEKLNSGQVRRAAGLKIGYQPQKVEALEKSLADVHIPHLLNASIHTLSGGEFQRVMLARAILRRPDLLVLDEPEQNVDTAGAVEIYQLPA